MVASGLPDELDVVRDIAERLGRAGVPFMLTGSLAMNYYAEPRMTRDIDLVLDLGQEDVERVATMLEPEYYLDRGAMTEAVRLRSSFNLIHREAVMKVDCFPRKPGAFREAEFQRRQPVVIAGTTIPIVTREDLILAKLLWARESASAVQLRDLRNLTADGFDEEYVAGWVARLDLADLWERVRT